MTPLSRRRFLAHSAAAVGAAAGAASLLDGADTRPVEAAHDRSATTLTIMGYTGEVLPAYVKEFQRQHPEYKVVFLNYDPVRLNAMLNAGQPPDWTRIQSCMDLPHLAALGLATNLDPFIAKSKVLSQANLLPVNDNLRWDGHTQGRGPYYAICHGYEPENTLWYNKSLFAQAGVKPLSTTTPLSYEELLRLAKKLTVRKGGKIRVYGFDALWGAWTQLFMLNMLAQEGKSFWNSSLTAVDFTTPEARKVLQWYVDWAQAHVGPSPLDPSPQGTGPLFMAGREAMAQEGFWFEGEIKQLDPKIFPHAGYAPAPLWGAKRVDASLAGADFYIPATAKNKDGGWKFMEYYIAGRPGRDRASNGWGLPAIKSLEPLVPQKSPEEQEILAITKKEVRYMDILHYSPYLSEAAFEAALTQYIVPVMQGKVKLDDGAKQLTDALNKQVRIAQQQIG